MFLIHNGNRGVAHQDAGELADCGFIEWEYAFGELPGSGLFRRRRGFGIGGGRRLDHQRAAVAHFSAA